MEFQNGSLNNANVQHELYTKDDKTFVKVETKISYKGEVKRDSTCNDFLAVVDRRTQQVRFWGRLKCPAAQMEVLGDFGAGRFRCADAQR